MVENEQVVEPTVGRLVSDCKSQVPRNTGLYLSPGCAASTTPEPLPHAKPMLATPAEQIAKLKSLGVTFDLCGEDEAAAYLAAKTYLFKLMTYRELFDRRLGGERDGQYVGLDFGHLVRLASVDRTLRYTLLPMTLDVEHFARVRLVRGVESRPGEDGYTVVSDYMASLNHDNRRRRLGEINMLAKDAYCGDLVRKYADDMPIWAFLELVSFGSFIDLYLFCAERWGDKRMVEEHYMLRLTKSARNAAAHSSNMINGFGRKGGALYETSASVAMALTEAGISKRVRGTKMSNPRLQQVATLLYMHARMVPEGTSKERARDNVKRLSAEMGHVLDDLPHNDAVRSSFSFLITLFDKWF